MPSGAVKQETEYSLPAGERLPCVLESVDVKTISPRPGGKQFDPFDKWVWTFKIIDGEYEGLHAYGETVDFYSTRADNQPRQWHEAISGRPLDVGEGFDTDDLLALPCFVIVRNDEPRQKRDGGMFYPCPVDSVLPVDSEDDLPF